MPLGNSTLPTWSLSNNRWFPKDAAVTYLLCAVPYCHFDDIQALRESFAVDKTRQFNANGSVFPLCVVFLVT